MGQVSSDCLAVRCNAKGRENELSIFSVKAQEVSFILNGVYIWPNSPICMC